MIGSVTTIGQTGQYAPGVGYVAALYLVPEDQVLFTQDPDYVTDPPVGIVTDAEIVEFKIRHKDGTFSESKSQDANGTTYGAEISIGTTTTGTALVAWVRRNEGRRFVALWMDSQGASWITGVGGNGLRLGWSRTTGGLIRQAISLSGRTAYPTQPIATISPEVLFPDTEFDYSFDVSFY